MPSGTQQRVNELPCGIPSDGLTAVKRLFWTELNYAVECLAAVRYPRNEIAPIRDPLAELGVHFAYDGGRGASPRPPPWHPPPNTTAGVGSATGYVHYQTQYAIIHTHVNAGGLSGQICPKAKELTSVRDRPVLDRMSFANLDSHCHTSTP